MKRKIIIGIIITIFVLANIGFFSWLKNHYAQYQAVQQCAAGDPDAACSTFASQLVNAPHDDQLNYNLGVANYRKKNYDIARDAFTRATKSSDSIIQEVSYYNLGNSQVALEKLEEAIAAYEQALKINPNNEYAKHNLELARELLRKKNEQKEQEKQNQQNSDQKNKDQKDDQKNKDQDNQSGQGSEQDKKESDQDQNQERKNQNQNKNQKNSSQDKNSSGKNAEQNERSSEQKQDEKKANQQFQQSQQEEKSQENQQEQQLDSDKQQNQADRKEAQEQQATQADKEKEQQVPSLREQAAAAAAQDLERKLDEKLLKVLTQAEHQDEDQYRKMIKSHVKEMPRHEGQKNW